jgi:hypothetical protein
MRNPPSISVTLCMRAPRRFDVSADLDFLMTAHSVGNGLGTESNLPEVCTVPLTTRHHQGRQRGKHDNKRGTGRR